MARGQDQQIRATQSIQSHYPADGLSQAQLEGEASKY